MSAWLVVSTAAVQLFYLWTGMNAARYRVRHKIEAPAMHGHPEVERALRVQGNTLEWLVIMVPSLWMFGLYFDPRYAAALSAVWIVGRWLYMVGYVREPAQRGTGFLIQAFATVVLLLGALGGAIWLLVRGGDV